MLIGFDASRVFVSQRTGTENYSYCLLVALAKLDCGHKFRVYLKSKNKNEEADKQQIPVLSSQATKFELKTLSWPYFWTQGGLALETWRLPPDLLFIPAHVVPIFKNPRVPIVVTVHDLRKEFFPQHSNWLQKIYLNIFVERLRATLATHIIAVSKNTKRDIVQMLKVPEEKVSVVYEGVDHKKFKVQNSKSKMEEVKKKYNIRGDYVLFVGTVQPRKNLIRLINAFTKIIKEADKRYFEKGSFLELVIVGKKGWLSREIYETPEHLGVESRVRFLGHIADEDLPALYSGARVFCLPSLYEGFGLPILEAMACGTPVVISNISSLPEVGGEVAIYIDPYDVDGIARGIGEVLSLNPSERQQMIERGIKHAKKFSWEKCAYETLQVLEEVGRRKKEYGMLLKRNASV